MVTTISSLSENWIGKWQFLVLLEHTWVHHLYSTSGARRNVTMCVIPASSSLKCSLSLWRICMCSSKKCSTFKTAAHLKLFMTPDNTPFCLLCNPMHHTCYTRPFLTARSSSLVTHKSLQISWLWLLPALADDAGNKFGVSLFECNLGLWWPAEVTITSNWRVNDELD